MLIKIDMNITRSYAMSNRAASSAATRQRVLHAVVELAAEKLTADIVLTDVAGRAEVSVQTVLRHFGSKDGLFDAAVEYARSEVEAERVAPVGDIDGALRVIVSHYESRGDWVIALLGQESPDGRIRSITQPGRELHRRWVETVFGTQLAGRAESAREPLIDLLVVATDVYTWKLLRRDRGLDRQETEQRMRRLVEAILATHEDRS